MEDAIWHDRRILNQRENVILNIDIDFEYYYCIEYEFELNQVSRFLFFAI